MPLDIESAEYCVVDGHQETAREVGKGVWWPPPRDPTCRAGDFAATSVHLQIPHPTLNFTTQPFSSSLRLRPLNFFFALAQSLA